MNFRRAPKNVSEGNGLQPRRTPWIARRGVLLGLVIGAAIGALVGVSSIGGGKSPARAASVPPFVDSGNFPTTATYQNDSITIGPPAPTAMDQYTATAQDIYNAFESTSPAAPVASQLGYGTAAIYRASYTDLQMGAVNTSTRGITPTFDNSPVWILIYTNVQWPSSPAGPGVGASPTTAATSPKLSGAEVVFAVFSPSGQCLDTIVTPSA